VGYVKSLGYPPIYCHQYQSQIYLACASFVIKNAIGGAKILNVLSQQKWCCHLKGNFCKISTRNFNQKVEMCLILPEFICGNSVMIIDQRKILKADEKQKILM